MERSKSILSKGAGKGKQQTTAGVNFPGDEKLLQIVPPTGPPISYSAPLNRNWIQSSNSRSFPEGTSGQAGARTSRPPGRDANSNSFQIDFSDLEDELTPLSDNRNQIDHTAIFPRQEFDSDEEESSGDGGGDGKRSGCTGSKRKRIWDAPEQRITMFAFRVALLEKTASGLGTLAFLWATVVILGGFASNVSGTTFWVVTLIILAESARIFNRSHELEWHDQSTKSNVHTPVTQLKAISGKLKAWSSSKVTTGNTHRRRWFGFLRGKGSSGTAQKSQPVGGSSDSTNSEVTMGTRTGPSGSELRRKQRQSRGPSPKRRAPGGKSGTELRKWSPNTFPLVPFLNNSLTSRIVSRILSLAQLVSALLCIGLSIWRLSMQKFIDPTARLTLGPKSNLIISLNVFHALAILESAFFLLERAYWAYRMRFEKLLDSVALEMRREGEDGKMIRPRPDEEFELPEVLNSFLYEVYSQCLTRSVFDGLDMDLVGFGIKWLQSEHMNQQLDGAKLLRRLISKRHVSKKDGTKKYGTLSKDALRRLGTTPGIIERIVEMLSWNSQGEEELYGEIARITRCLVVYSRNCARFVAVPGALDAVVSLLAPDNNPDDSEDEYANLELQLEGLTILKCLCKDPKNALKVGDSRGLLSTLIAFIEVKNVALPDKKEEFEKSDKKGLRKRYKKSLQVICALVSNSISSGEILRQRIARIVSGLTHLKAILQRFDNRPELQVLSITILHRLALEDNLRDSIGATGGVIRILFDLYTQYDALNLSLSGPLELEEKELKMDKRHAAVLAGEALTRLMLQNERNCLKLLYLRTEQPLVKVMLESLEKRNVNISNVAANIMRSLLQYADQKTKAEIARGCAPIMIDNIFSRNTSKPTYEASLGLVARAIDALDTPKYLDVLSNVDKAKFVEHIVKTLRHTPTTKKYPKIRRYAVEFITAIINKDDSLLDTFERHKYPLKKWLQWILDSISEVENYCLFSGEYGYTRHREEMEALVERCMLAVDAYYKRKFPSSTTATDEERAL